MAQRRKFLLEKCEDLSLNLQYLLEWKLATVACDCNPVKRKVETEEPWDTREPVSLVCVVAKQYPRLSSALHMQIMAHVHPRTQICTQR